MRRAALQGSSRPDLITDGPRPAIIGMSVRHTVCNGTATVDVTLENYGGTSTMGTLKVYADGREGEGTTVELDPYYPETFTLTVPAGPGDHTFKAVLTYPGGSDSMSEAATLLKDSDCDGLGDREEYEYGTNPFNRDTDGDGVADSLDMNPVGNYMVTVYILRAKALDDVDGSLTGHNPADMSLDVTVDGKEKTLLLTDNRDDREKKILPAFNPLVNIENYAIAKATFDVPDGKAIIPITFHLYDRDNDDGTKRTEMDVSPGPGSVATIYYDLRTGRWWGDDYPGDESHYFGYGHLSGCGDGSCGITAHEPDKDLKVYSKYEGILRKNGISGEVLRLYHVENSTQVQWRSGGGLTLVKNPRKVLIAEVLLGNGSLINVTLVNTYSAKVLRLRQIKLPAKPDAPLSGANLTNAGVEMNASAITDSGEVKLPAKVVAYSSEDEHDGEIWFVIVPNDPDGIPFWREVELNRELEKQGSPYRFDPSDGFGIDDPDLYEDLIQMDELGDYDGDGVPNAVEQLIGKDPAERDILGIQLNVSVEWPMSEEDEKNLAYSIRKASDFIYDYTDGYAMITKVRIWDNKRNWEKADVRVHDTYWIIPQTPFETLYSGWQKSTVGGYWMKRSPDVKDNEKSLIFIMMPEKYQGMPGNGGSIGDVSWGRTLGHELGHYVFWLGDEYMDWHGHIYPSWYSGILSAIPSPILRYYAYKILSDDFMSIHSVMNKQWKWSELSTPKDYEKFKKDADELWDKTSIIWKLQGYNSPKDMLTDQWAGDMSRLKDMQTWNRSAWGALYTILTGSNEPSWLSKIDSMRNRPLLHIDLKIDKNFKPKTGPYTGVGYYMEVRWG